MKSEPGFTKFDNYFLDHVMRRVTSVEWKIISAIIRETVGWHRKDAEISLDRFMELTGVGRQAVVAGIKRARARTVVERRSHQAGKQRSFRYSAVPHANLKSVPKPDPRRHQQAFPFASEYENQTPLDSLKIKLPTDVSEYENQTPTGPVLRSRKKDQDLKKEKHTHEVEFGATAGNGVCEQLVKWQKKDELIVGQTASDSATPISEERLKAYANAHRKIPGIKGGITDPPAWVTVAKRTREWDATVLEWEQEEAVRIERAAAWRAQQEAERLQYETDCAERIARAEASRAEEEARKRQREREEAHARERARQARETSEREAYEKGKKILEEITQRRQAKAAGG